MGIRAQGREILLPHFHRRHNHSADYAYDEHLATPAALLQAIRVGTKTAKDGYFHQAATHHSGVPFPCWFFGVHPVRRDIRQNPLFCRVGTTMPVMFALPYFCVRDETR